MITCLDLQEKYTHEKGHTLTGIITKVSSLCPPFHVNHDMEDMTPQLIRQCLILYKYHSTVLTTLKSVVANMYKLMESGLT